MNPRLKAQPRSLEDEALWRNSLSRPGSRPHCRFRPNEQHLLIANEMPGASVAVALDDATVAIRDRQDIAAVAISFLRLRSKLAQANEEWAGRQGRALDSGSAVLSVQCVSVQNCLAELFPILC